jgi:cytochrome b6-f complex iron-sulfur subunit
MNRREFMTWAGAGFLATSLPVALAACSSAPSATAPSPSSALPPPPSGMATSAASEGFTAIADLADLQPDTAIEAMGPGKKPIAITGDAKKVESIVAVNPTCTHNGCTVKWNAQKKEYVCPCHGSDFAASGTVNEGPASKPLPTYEVRVENGKIMVKV